MMMRLRTRHTHLRRDAVVTLPRGGGESHVREVLLMLFCVVFYEIGHGMATGREDIAMANGVAIMEAEKAMGIYIEPWLQGLVSRVDFLMGASVAFYQYVHMPVTVGCLVWLYMRRAEAWQMFRNWFITINIMAVTVFALMPTAPPRMILSAGIVDMAYLRHWTDAIIAGPSPLANPYAAVPSLHMGYALFVAIAVFMLAQGRWVRWLAAAYPFAVLFTIVVTGNHFVLDAVAGGLVVMAAYYAVAKERATQTFEAVAIAVRQYGGG
jgi:hypothetical protein